MDPEKGKDSISPFSIGDVRLFIAFRVFFNSRFYYPVFTILFLDFGLTVAQFSILNGVWAATIVLAEVPLGALADMIGRRRLLMGATLIMIVELSVICFVPTENLTLVFWVFLFNRFLSGVAEAAASGADEAVAYDALAEHGKSDQWGRVLEVVTRFQSMGFILAMSLGAAVYDPDLMSGIFSFLSIDMALNQQITMRFPLYLTLLLSFFAFYSTFRMEDKNHISQRNENRDKSVSAMKLTLQAGVWILKNPFALSVILFGMLFDGIIRVVITLSSQYYRLIDLPESSFGVLGSIIALLGFVVPGIARNIAEKRPPSFSLLITAVLTATGLISMSFFWPYAGLLPAIITFSAMYFTGFLVSYHLNRTAESSQRATVLSFKGLAYNISYGVLSMLYAILLKVKKEDGGVEISQDSLFIDTFVWFPGTFFILLIILLIFYSVFLKPGMRKS